MSLGSIDKNVGLGISMFSSSFSHYPA